MSKLGFRTNLHFQTPDDLPVRPHAQGVLAPEDYFGGSDGIHSDDPASLSDWASLMGQLINSALDRRLPVYALVEYPEDQEESFGEWRVEALTATPDPTKVVNVLVQIGSRLCLATEYFGLDCSKYPIEKPSGTYTRTAVFQEALEVLDLASEALSRLQLEGKPLSANGQPHIGTTAPLLAEDIRRGDQLVSNGYAFKVENVDRDGTTATLLVDYGDGTVSQVEPLELTYGTTHDVDTSGRRPSLAQEL